MAKWNPQSDPVRRNEHVGRRLFDEPMLTGATNQPNWDGLNLRNFEETRGDRQLSLDRLGPTGVVRSVKQYLLVRARFAASLFAPPRTFNGWIIVSAKFLEDGLKGKNFPAVASPQYGTGLEENIYHAHSELPNDLDSVSAALHVRHIFAKNGKVEESETNAESIDILPHWLTGFARRIQKLFKAI